MNISLIICTKDRPEVLKNNLIINSKELNTNDEIVIVDSSSVDISETLFNNFNFPNLFLYRVKPNKQYQRNFGVAHASGDIFVFLDDDIRLFNDSIKCLREFFESNEDVMAITGGLKERNEPSKSKRLFEKLFSKIFFTPCFGKSGFTKSGLPIIPTFDEKEHKARFLRGGFSAYRKEVFNFYNFDEFFQGYSYLEDNDFSLSVTSKFQAVFLPKFSGFHDHLSSFQKDHSFNRKQYIENFYYIFNKHKIGMKYLFYWSSLGILIITLIKSLRKFNFSYFRGTFQGIIQVMKKK